MGSGIRRVGSRITALGSGITSHGIGIANQGSGQIVAFLWDQRPKFVTLLDSRIRNSGTKVGSAMKKHCLVNTVSYGTLSRKGWTCVTGGVQNWTIVPLDIFPVGEFACRANSLVTSGE